MQQLLCNNEATYGQGYEAMNMSPTHFLIKTIIKNQSIY